MSYKLTKSLLFRMDPEKAHTRVMRWLQGLEATPVLPNLVFPEIKNTKPVHIAGLTFPHPIGLAAGFDKNAQYVDQLAMLGFGHIEVGTVTPKPQDGNPKPRLFRLPKDEALLNRMGFNNAGVEAVKNNLQNRKSSATIIGGNIGKNKSTPNEDAEKDYLLSFDALHEDVDYFVVNVSSPNTPDLRDLQDKEPLTKLLRKLQMKNLTYETPRPIFLKIAPDLNKNQLNDIIGIVGNEGIAGIVATNTTIERNLPHYDSEYIKSLGNGGVSGKPVRDQSTNIIEYLAEHSQGRIPIIGVGGVFSGADAQRKIDAGASLVQVYTGFVYQGAYIVPQILKNLKY